MSDLEVKESGKLEEKPALPRMLDMLSTPFKGVMIFVRGKDRKSFVFDESKPMISGSNLKEAILGKSLFENNIITVEQFNKIKQVEMSGKSFFDAALEVVGKTEILEYILTPWKQDLQTIATWDIGQFASVEMMPKEMIKIDLPKPLMHYLFQAMIFKNQKKRPKFSSYARFEIDANPDTHVKLEDLQLSETQKKIYESLKTSKTLKNVIQEAKIEEALIAPIIFALRDIGLVRADSDQKKKVAFVPPKTGPLPGTPVKPKFLEVTNAEKEDFLAKVLRLDKLDHFEVLGLTKTATLQEIQDNYFALAKKYHPDRLKNSPSIKVKDAERFFTRVTEAYNILSNPTSRKEYEHNISQNVADHEKLLGRILESEKLFTEGMNFLNKNVFKEAAEKFWQAIQLYDQEPEYYVKLGWASFRQGVKDGISTKIADAKKILQDSFGKKYHMADVSYYLGMISKHENNNDQAMKYFRSCLNEDPNYALASSELRLLERKSDGKGGKKK